MCYDTHNIFCILDDSQLCQMLNSVVKFNFILNQEGYQIFTPLCSYSVVDLIIVNLYHGTILHLLYIRLATKLLLFCRVEIYGISKLWNVFFHFSTLFLFIF